MTNESIIRQLERLRNEKGLSQEQVSGIIGTCRNTYGNLVRGKTKILNENLPALAELYGVSVEEILLGYKPVDPSSNTLRDNNNFQEQKQALIDDYEKRLAVDRELLAQKDKVIASHETTIHTLEGMVSMLQKKQKK